MKSKNESFQNTTSLGIILIVINFGIMFYIDKSHNIGIGHIFGFFVLPIFFLLSVFIFFKSLFLLFKIEVTNNELILFLIYIILIFIHIWYMLPPIKTPFFE